MFQTTFLLPEVLPLVKISAKLDHILGVRLQKPPEKGHFMYGESVRKKNILTTTNAMLIKHTMVVYLHGRKNLLEPQIQFFWRNF